MTNQVDYGSRSSGRTTRMIMALKPGTLVAVADRQHKEFICEKIRKLRGPKFKFEVWLATDDAAVLTAIATKRPLAADHYYWDRVSYRAGRLLEDALK